MRKIIHAERGLLAIFTVLFVLMPLLITDVDAKSKNAFPEVPSFSDMLDISNYSGKTVYLDFWATWCIPCRKSFPWMDAMKKKYSGKGFEIVLVNLDKKKIYVDEFMKEYPVENSVMILDPKGTLARLYHVRAMPTAYLIDRKGKIRYMHQGYLAKRSEGYESEIRELLNEKP